MNLDEREKALRHVGGRLVTAAQAEGELNEWFNERPDSHCTTHPLA
jgi:hypothetical protein